MRRSSTIETSAPTREVYLQAVTQQVPRLLGLMDRNEASESFGCFDRNYWQYRVVDTPSARCQEAVLTLALLQAADGPVGYAGQNALGRWANAGLSYWRTLQLRDGSFNEWYPQEHSFVATAFSTYAVSEAMMMLRTEQVEESEALQDSLAKAGRWLMMHHDDRALNQTVGSVLALYNVGLVTGNQQFTEAARRRVAMLAKRQSAEGWFPEYGGADLGYLSLAVAYLAKLHQKSAWPEALELAVRAVRFLASVIRTGGASGGEFGSRLTEYLMPDGLELLAFAAPEAAWLGALVRRQLADGVGVSLHAFDDRYLTYVGYNFLQAYRAACELPDVSESASESAVPEGWRRWPEAGVAVCVQPQYSAIVNAHRGGAFTLVFKSGKRISDGGLTAQMASGSLLHSGFWDEAVDTDVTAGRLTVRGRFRVAKRGLMSPARTVCLRVFQSTLGRLGQVGVWMKDRLRRWIIMPTLRDALQFERTIHCTDARVEVHDRVWGAGGRLRVSRLLVGGRGSLLYTPSSRFFTQTDLTEPPAMVFQVDGWSFQQPLAVVRVYTPAGMLADWQLNRSDAAAAQPKE